MHAMRWLKQSRETVCRPSGPTRKYTNVTVGLSNTCQLPQSTKHMTTTQHTHAYRDVVCREAVDDELVKAPILARALNALHELTKLSRHDNNKSKNKNKESVGCSIYLHSPRYSLRATRVHEASRPTCHAHALRTQRSLQHSIAAHMCHQDSQHGKPCPQHTQDSQHQSAQPSNAGQPAHKRPVQ